MIRRALSVIVGLLVAMLGISLVELAGQALFAPPAGVDMDDAASITRAVDHIPAGLKVSVVLAWFAGTLAGGSAGLAISRWTALPWIVAAGVILGAIASYMQIPHPLWMRATGIALPLLAAWLALRIMGRAEAR